MKTNVIVKSPDRELFGVKIRQETKTGNLNLSDLQDAYDKQRIINGWSRKYIKDLLFYKGNLERVYYIAKKQGFIKVCFHTFIEESNKTTPAKLLKKYGLMKTKGGRENKTVWANPYLWVMIAMELNPMLYAEVISWITDKLILNRIEAGNFYRGLSKAITKFKNVNYSQVAKGLNYIIFGKHETGIRNTATSEQLKELANLEKKMAFAIDMGYIKTYNQFISDLRKLYNKKTKQHEKIA